MKIFFVLFCLEFINAAMPHERTGGNERLLSNHVKKIRSKFVGRPLTQMKATFLLSGEREQNKLLESISPEYKYQDYNDNSENTDNQNNLKISNLLDEKIIQELASKHLLDSESKQSTRAKPALSFMKGLTPIGNRPRQESLEQLNIMLQNTLPEYQFDRAEKGPGFSYDSCVDLDPDCWKYEMHGLCSDSPDLAEKRFNCKKTCHLCVSVSGTRTHTKKGAKKH